MYGYNVGVLSQQYWQQLQQVANGCWSGYICICHLQPFKIKFCHKMYYCFSYRQNEMIIDAYYGRFLFVNMQFSPEVLLRQKVTLFYDVQHKILGM